MSIWARIDTTILSDEKLLELEDDHALGSMVYVAAILYCRGRMTDGVFPRGAVLAALPYLGLAEVTRILDRLVDTGLIERAAGDYRVAGYDRWQQTADEVDSLTEKRRAAGKKGAQARWNQPVEPVDNSESPSDGKIDVCHIATEICHDDNADVSAGSDCKNGKRDGKTIANDSKPHGKAMAEKEREKERRDKPSSSSGRPSQVGPAPLVDNFQSEEEFEIEDETWATGPAAVTAKRFRRLREAMESRFGELPTAQHFPEVLDAIRSTCRPDCSGFHCTDRNGGCQERAIERVAHTKHPSKLAEFVRKELSE